MPQVWPLLLCASLALAQGGPQRVVPSAPGSDAGWRIRHARYPGFHTQAGRSSQTVAALSPRRRRVSISLPAIFCPALAEWLLPPGRSGPASSQGRYGSVDGLFHRVCAAAGHSPCPSGSDRVAAADLAPALPPDIPLRIVRSWAVDGGALVLRFSLTNRSAGPVQIGALGIPMVFNNVLTNRSLDQAHAAVPSTIPTSAKTPVICRSRG